MSDKYVAYAGSYTHESSKGIHIYDMDVEKGRITERKEVQIDNPLIWYYPTAENFYILSVTAVLPLTKSKQTVIYFNQCSYH